MSGVSAGTSRDVLREHPALDRAEMPHEITKCERARLVGPLESLWRNTPKHACRAAANTFQIWKKFVDGSELHVRGVECPLSARAPCSPVAPHLDASDLPPASPTWVSPAPRPRC